MKYTQKAVLSSMQASKTVGANTLHRSRRKRKEMLTQIPKSALAPNNISAPNIGTDLSIPLSHSNVPTEVVVASGCSFSSPSSMEMPQINETQGLASSLASPNDSSKPVRDLKLEAAQYPLKEFLDCPLDIE